MPQARIKVFWDLESCPPPSFYPGSHWDLLKSVRLFTSRFGVITSIKAYWDHNQNPSPRESNDSQLRAVMPSMGISLVDCALMEEYSGESLARTLIVDFMLSAVDDPVDVEKPGRDIIMIFSGNKTILHPISLLMFRGYTIALVVPDENKDIEASRSTRVFDWQADVLGLRHNQGSESASRPGTEHLQPQDLSMNGTTQAPQNVDMDASAPVSPPHLPRSIAPPMSPQKSVSSSVPSYMMSPHLHRHTIPIHSTAPRPFTTTTASNTTPKMGLKSIPAFGSPGSRAPSVLSLHSETGSSGIGHTTSESSGRSSDIHAQMLGQITPIPGQGQAGDTSNSWGMGSDWDPTSSSWSPRPAAELGLGQPNSEAPATLNIIQPNSQSRPQGPGVAQLKTELKQESPKTQSGLEPQLGQLGSSKSGNTAFKPLLQLLRKAKAEGKSSVLRSQAGEMLGKDKNVYLAAGVISFSGYVALAAQKGLIELGGTGGKDWIALKT